MRRQSAFFIIFLIPFISSGQTLTGHFFRLRGPEKAWVVTHLFKAKRAFRISLETRRVTNEVKGSAVLDTFQHGGRLDAFRHSYWMARLATEIGPKASRKLGKAHEKSNYKAFRKGDPVDGVLQDATAVEMDLFNNEEGLKISAGNPEADPEKLKNIVIFSIRNGNMKILKRNEAGSLCDCAGRVVNLPLRTKKDWKLPYCLVPSDSP